MQRPAEASSRPVPRRQRGLSIVELLVGAAIALSIAAAAAAVTADTLRESRALLVETRLLQDLRGAADLVTRDLRRAGYWGAAASGVWQRAAERPAANPYTELTSAPAASDSVLFRVSQDAIENGLIDADEQLGFRLHSGSLELQLGANNWQALTDPGSLIVTRFSVLPSVDEIALDGYCAQACATGSASCPPRQQVRSLAIAIDARSAVDPRVLRSVRSSVRLRNDRIVGSCP